MSEPALTLAVIVAVAVTGVAILAITWDDEGAQVMILRLVLITVIAFFLGIGLTGCGAITPNAESGIGAGYVIKCGDKTIEVASQRDIEKAEIEARAGDCEVKAKIESATSEGATRALAESVKLMLQKVP